MTLSQKLRLAPLVLMLLITSLLATGLFNDIDKVGKRMGKELDNFSIERLDKLGIKMNRSAWKGQVAMINIFATWCAPCRAEHPILMDLARKGIVPIYGVAWRDKPEAIISWLQRAGNPYQMIGHDPFGNTMIPFSLTGVPETLIVGKDGIVYYHHVSALTPLEVNEIIIPLIERLNAM